MRISALRLHLFFCWFEILLLGFAGNPLLSFLHLLFVDDLRMFPFATQTLEPNLGRWEKKASFYPKIDCDEVLTNESLSPLAYACHQGP